MFTKEVNIMDEDYIADEPVQEIETVEESLGDSEYVETIVDAAPVATENYGSLLDQLTGTPQRFSKSDVKILKKLADQGLAADFGADGWARGYKWHLPR